MRPSYFLSSLRDLPRRMGPVHGVVLVILVLAGLAWWVASGGRGSPAAAWEQFKAAREVADGDAAGGGFEWRASVRLGNWLAAVMTTLIGAVALVTVRWWGGGGTSASRWVRPSRPRRLRFTVLVLGALTMAVFLRMPLARGSLWWDELWNFRYATVGEWKAPKDGGVKEFREWDWARAFWYYGKPTNHPVQTVPGKLVEQSWRLVAGYPAGEIHEVALRLPVLVGGLAGIVLTAALARRWAGDGAGVVAAWLMALHPWLLRYGVDARSYGMTVWIVPMTLLAGWEALTPPGGGRWRWWWLLACGFCLLMWAHVLSHAALCAGLYVTGILAIRRANPERAVRARLVARLTAMAGLAACVFLVLYLPCLLQALCWGERNQDGNLLTRAYFLETLAQMGSGASVPEHPAVALFLVLAVAGCLLGRASVPGARLWMCGTLAGFGVFLGVVAVSGGYFYHRFLIGLAPVLVVGLASLVTRPRVPWLVAPAVVIGLGFLWMPSLQRLTSRSYCPWRETAAVMRESGDGKALCAGYGLGANMLECYLPELLDWRGKPLEALLAEAEAAGKPLYIAWAYHRYHESLQPEEMKRLGDVREFTPVAQVPGIEEQYDCRVVRWNGRR